VEDEMISFVKRFPLVIVIAVSLGFGIYKIVTEHEPAYCLERKRSLSDGELIEAGVRAASHSMEIDGSDVSIRTYYAMHPKCCSVRRLAIPQSQEDAGKFEVEIEYEVNDSARRDIRKKFYRELLRMNACGYVYERFGESTDGSRLR
jgi:hypothetical protein